MEELLVYTTIASYEGQEKYKLTALVEKEGYCMTSLEFKSKDGKLEYYDNDDFIFGELYSMLRLWITEKKVLDIDTLNIVLESIPTEDFEVVYNILNKGLELGFYKKK